MSRDAWMTATHLSRREKVTTQTIRHRIGGRHQRCERTPGGHDWVRVPVEPGTILHARASSARQCFSLDTEERLPRARYPDGRVVRDTGSGVDFRRRGLVALLERALRGEAVHVVAATPDRITRSGYPLIRHVVELSGGGIAPSAVTRLLTHYSGFRITVTVMQLIPLSFCDYGDEASPWLSARRSLGRVRDIAA